MPRFYSTPLRIESALAPDAVRSAIQRMVAARLLIDTPRFRRRQIIGWKLAERANDFVLQPNYVGSLSNQSVRFVGTIEATSTGSRILGRVTHPWYTRIVTSVFIVFVLIAVVSTLAEGREPAEKVVAIATTMLAGAVLLVRLSLSSTAGLIEEGLQAGVLNVHQRYAIGSAPNDRTAGTGVA